MLAFGSAVARRMGDMKFLVFSVLCGIAGRAHASSLPLSATWRRSSGPRRRFRARWPARSDSSSRPSGSRVERTPDFYRRAADEPRPDPDATSASLAFLALLGGAQRLFRPERHQDRRRARRHRLGGAYRRVSLRACSIFGAFDRGKRGRGRTRVSLETPEFACNFPGPLRVFPVRDRMSQSRD